MVRFLKVSHLEEQRRVLVARSEIHRRTLQVEVANLKYSASLIKQRFGPLRVVRHLLKLSAPLAAIFLARKKRPADAAGGFLASVLSGVRFAAGIMPLFQKAQPAPETEKSAQQN